MKHKNYRNVRFIAGNREVWMGFSDSSHAKTINHDLSACPLGLQERVKSSRIPDVAFEMILVLQNYIQ